MQPMAVQNIGHVIQTDKNTALPLAEVREYGIQNYNNSKPEILYIYMYIVYGEVYLYLNYIYIVFGVVYVYLHYISLNATIFL